MGAGAAGSIARQVVKQEGLSQPPSESGPCPHRLAVNLTAVAFRSWPTLVFNLLETFDFALNMTFTTACWLVPQWTTRNPPFASTCSRCRPVSELPAGNVSNVDVSRYIDSQLLDPHRLFVGHHLAGSIAGIGLAFRRSGGFVACQSDPAIARLKLQPISSSVFLPLGASIPTGAAHAATKRRARPRAECGRGRVAPSLWPFG